MCEQPFSRFLHTNSDHRPTSIMREDLEEILKLPRAAAPDFIDKIWKTIHGVELGVRIWPARNAVGPAPFITWHHGGGFLAGSHFAPLAWMEPGLRQRGWHVVSPAYRLAPQVSLEDQVDECIESIHWCREHLPGILGEGTVDVDKFVISGESAGGTYVALMGCKMSPPPSAIIEANGVVDFLDPFYGHLARGTNPDPAEWKGEFSAEELDKAMQDRDPRNCLADSLWGQELGKHSEDVVAKQWRTDFEYTPIQRRQAEMHLYRTAKYGLSQTFHQEKYPTDQEYEAWLKNVSTLYLLDGLKTFPPTVLLHGIADAAVPISQSQRFAEKLKSMDVPVIECYEPSGPHAFDDVYVVRAPACCFSCHALTFTELHSPRMERVYTANA